MRVCRAREDLPEFEHIHVERFPQTGLGIYHAYRERLSSLRPDAVLFRNPNVLRFAPLLRRRTKVYFVKGLYHRELAERRDPWSRCKAPFFHAAESVLLRGADLVFVHSDRLREYLIERMAAPAGRLQLLRSCSPRMDAHNRRRSGPVRVCFIGTGEPWHDLREVDRLFASLEKLPQVECHFFVPSLEGMTRRSRASVSFLSPRAALQALLEMDVGVAMGTRSLFATRHASPIKVAEYLACGLGLILNDATGDYPKLLGGRDFCLLLEGDRYDEEALHAWIGRFLDPEFRRRVKSAAKAYADRHLTWEAHAGVFAEAIERVVPRRPAPPDARALSS